MANHKSALKRARQSEDRRMRNRMIKTRVKNVTKNLKQVVDETPGQSQDVLKAAMKVIDKAASAGTIHRRTASRKIARLSRLVAKAQATPTA